MCACVQNAPSVDRGNRSVGCACIVYCTGQGGWGEFHIGVGGMCKDRQPAAGYWCTPTAPRAISAPNHPVGLRTSSVQLPHLPYQNATGAVVHAWRPGHWYTNTFEVGSALQQQRDSHGDSILRVGVLGHGPSGGGAGSASRGQAESSEPTRDAGVGVRPAASTSKLPRQEHQHGGDPRDHQRDHQRDSRRQQHGPRRTSAASPRPPDVPPSGEEGHHSDERHEATLHFARGGTQGAEGLGHAESWYVENVLEELDSPGEWFYNASTRTLFYFPNATHKEEGGDVGHRAAQPASRGFVATSLQVLINVSGSHQHLVRALALSMCMHSAHYSCTITEQGHVHCVLQVRDLTLSGLIYNACIR